MDSLDDLDDLPTNDFEMCTACHDSRVKELAKAKKLLARHGPLRGLELYSGRRFSRGTVNTLIRLLIGAGGLGSGFEASQFVKTKWAVEFSPSASLTYEYVLSCIVEHDIEFWPG